MKWLSSCCHVLNPKATPLQVFFILCARSPRYWLTMEWMPKGCWMCLLLSGVVTPVGTPSVFTRIWLFVTHMNAQMFSVVKPKFIWVIAWNILVWIFKQLLFCTCRYDYDYAMGILFKLAKEWLVVVGLCVQWITHSGVMIILSLRSINSLADLLCEVPLGNRSVLWRGLS